MCTRAEGGIDDRVKKSRNTTLARLCALAAVLLVPITPVQAAEFSCSPQKYCGDMRNCAEAVFFLRQCGHKKRDGNSNGIPCEKLCGKTQAVMEKRLKAQGGILDGGVDTVPLAVFSCSARKTCGQVASCAEARFQLETCGNKALDGDRDGTPCNALCR